MVMDSGSEMGLTRVKVRVMHLGLMMGMAKEIN